MLPDETRYQNTIYLYLRNLNNYLQSCTETVIMEIQSEKSELFN